MINIYGFAGDRLPDNSAADDNHWLHVSGCGFQKFLSRSHVVSRPHGRTDFQLIFITRGRGYFDFQDSRRTIDGGSVVLFWPNQPQQYHYLCEDHSELYWLHFSGRTIYEMLAGFNQSQPLVLTVGLRESWILLFDQMIHELQMKRPAFSDQVNACFLQLMADLKRSQTQYQLKSCGHENEEIDQIIQIMHRQYQRPWTLAQLARKANLSVFHFAHKFKLCTGLTPLQYLTRIRIHTAMDLLASTMSPIKEVANIVGYTNPLYFSRVFRRETNKSPSNYRRDVRD